MYWKNTAVLSGDTVANQESALFYSNIYRSDDIEILDTEHVDLKYTTELIYRR